MIMVECQFVIKGIKKIDLGSGKTVAQEVCNLLRENGFYALDVEVDE